MPSYSAPPSYGQNQLPGTDTGIQAGSWAEFLPQLDAVDLSGKCIALYGLGNQEKYSERFADSLIHLYNFFAQRGAQLVGDWDTEGYHFTHSQAVVDDRFVGLVLDQQSQSLLTEQRLDAWLTQITPTLTEKLRNRDVAVV